MAPSPSGRPIEWIPHPQDGLVERLDFLLWLLTGHIQVTAQHRSLGMMLRHWLGPDPDEGARSRSTPSRIAALWASVVFRHRSALTPRPLLHVTGADYAVDCAEAIALPTLTS